MNEFLTVITAVLPVFGLMVVGLWLRKRNALTAEADKSLMWLVVNVLIPALIFNSVVRNAALRQPENLLLAPVIGFGMVLVGIIIARVLAPLAGLKSLPERRTFAFLTGLQNYSYLCIPLCLSLFDDRTVGVLFVHNVGVETAMWTVGLFVLAGGAWEGGWKKVFNAPLVALLLGLALNFLCAEVTLPSFLSVAGTILLTGIKWLGQSAIPLALLLIGAVIADHLHEARGGRTTRVAGVAVLVRLGIMPVLFLLLAKYFPCSLELKRVIVLQGSVPSAVFPIILAKHYGGDPRTALQVVLGTSLLGLITIPLWIHFGGHAAGLW